MCCAIPSPLPAAPEAGSYFSSSVLSWGLISSKHFKTQASVTAFPLDARGTAPPTQLVGRESLGHLSPGPRLCICSSPCAHGNVDEPPLPREPVPGSRTQIMSKLSALLNSTSVGALVCHWDSFTCMVLQVYAPRERLTCCVVIMCVMLHTYIFFNLKTDNERIFAQHLQNRLLPDHTYAVVSGGDPLCIPDLTWEQLKQFHATHYHPSNAR